MKIVDQEIHKRMVKARIEEDEIKRLLAEAVAAEAGQDLAGMEVRVFIGKDDTSTGFKTYAEVELTEHFQRAESSHERP